MKIISMYLPQFHRVKENDEWWGEGFTEWTTVKGAEKIFETHYQPHIPLEKNYYDLLDKKVMAWQAELMKKYGVDGQCIYHYWFKDSRQILEKPAENLLLWKEIDMPFCFCWANETWARSWSQISSKNTWAVAYEKGQDENRTGILLEQKYGNEKQWKAHFDYLLPFFKDDRYIKKDGKPVFLIYQAAKIFCLNDMMKMWDEWSKEYGFNGLYIIGANSSSGVESCLDSILYHEPQNTIRRRRCDNDSLPIRLEYDLVWQELLSYQSVKDKAIYGGFVGYDDTPRRGKEGVIIENAGPDKFKMYLTELLAKNSVNGNDLIFINAWNEWGEGMHLEPDEKYKYGYLEGILHAKEHYKEFTSNYSNAFMMSKDSFQNEITIWANRSARNESYWRILDAWLCLKENGISLEKYFVEKSLNSIAIYGMGMLGKHLLNELKNGKVEVKYAVDRKSSGLNVDLKIYSPEEDLPVADAIVVTATYAYMEIKTHLMARGYSNIISLEEIVFEMN